MNQSPTPTCTFCSQYGHTIQFCSDPQIEDCFKYLIGVSMQTTENALMALGDFTDILVCAIGVQRGRSLPSDTRGCHIEKIIDAVNIETEYLSLLTGIQREEYMRWLYPGEDDEDEEEDEDVLNIATIFDELPEVENTPICVLLACLETQEELAAPVECHICFDTKTIFDMDTFQCQHPFCHTCVLQMMVRTTQLCCPLCREQVKTVEVKDVDGYFALIKVDLARKLTSSQSHVVGIDSW